MATGWSQHDEEYTEFHGSFEDLDDPGPNIQETSGSQLTPYQVSSHEQLEPDASPYTGKQNITTQQTIDKSSPQTDVHEHRFHQGPRPVIQEQLISHNPQQTMYHGETYDEYLHQTATHTHQPHQGPRPVIQEQLVSYNPQQTIYQGESYDEYLHRTSAHSHQPHQYPDQTAPYEQQPYNEFQQQTATHEPKSYYPQQYPPLPDQPPQITYDPLQIFQDPQLMTTPHHDQNMQQTPQQQPYPSQMPLSRSQPIRSATGAISKRPYKTRGPSKRAGKLAPPPYSAEEMRVITEMKNRHVGKNDVPIASNEEIAQRLNGIPRRGDALRTAASVEGKWWRMCGGDAKAAQKARKLEAALKANEDVSDVQDGSLQAGSSLAGSSLGGSSLGGAALVGSSLGGTLPNDINFSHARTQAQPATLLQTSMPAINGITAPVGDQASQDPGAYGVHVFDGAQFEDDDGLAGYFEDAFNRSVEDDTLGWSGSIH